MTGSQQVSFWSVHEWVERITHVDDWPACGTPQWCALPDNDPAKIAAALDYAQHHALRVETAQEARAEASRAVAAAAPWGRIATEIRNRTGAHIPRRIA